MEDLVSVFQGDESCNFWETIGGGPGRFYLRAEYLSWWLRGQSLPPLVATSSPLVPQNNQGVLGQDTTAVLFGGSTLDSRQHSGGRFTAGYWLDSCQVWSLEASGFFLGREDTSFAANSGAVPVLARPFQVQNLGNLEFRELTASPTGVFSLNGSVSVNTPTELWGAEVNLRRKLCCGCDYRVDLLVGFRYLELRDGVHQLEDVTTLQPFPTPAFFPPGATVAPGDRFLVQDLFDTRNRFYGGQLGASGEFRRGRWIFGGTAKVALGVVEQTLDVQGSTTQFRMGQPILALPSGLFAQQFTNSGHFSQSQFAVAPEVGVKVGYQLTDHISAFVGYNFLYLSNVMRAGDQIDRSLDIRQVPFALGVPPMLTLPNPPGTTVAVPPVAGPSHPIVPFRTTDFWAHGVTVGLEIRY
jgi:hypothetical protein